MAVGVTRKILCQRCANYFRRNDDARCRYCGWSPTHNSDVPGQIYATHGHVVRRKPRRQRKKVILSTVRFTSPKSDWVMPKVRKSKRQRRKKSKAYT